MNFKQIKTLEKIETSLQRKQMILDGCDELINILDDCIKQSDQRLKLFDNHHKFKPFNDKETSNDESSDYIQGQNLSDTKFFSKRTKR